MTQNHKDTYQPIGRFLLYSTLVVLGIAFVLFLTLNTWPLYRHIDNNDDNKKSGEVTILHINDVYRIGGIDGQRQGGLARVVWLRKELERQGKTVLVTHAGDALSPSLLSDMYKGEKMIEILNLLAGKESGLPMLFTIGNHEFDLSNCTKVEKHKNFNVLQSRIAESNFIWLDGNLDYKANVAGTACHGWDENETTNKRKSYINIPVNGINLGFFGLTVTPGANDKNMPRNKKNNAEAAQDFVNRLRVESDFVIGLTHLEEKDDHMILDAQPGSPDLILGGHDHDYRASYEHDTVKGLMRLYKGSAEALEIVLIHLWKDKSGNVQYSQERIRLDEHIEPDEKVQEQINKIMSEHQTAYCQAYFGGEVNCLEKSFGQSNQTWILEELRNRAQETVFGNWLTRLMRDVYMKELPENFCPDNIGTASLYLSGSLRLNFDLPAKRPITRRIVEELFRYDKEPQYAVCVNGAIVYKAIEHGLQQRSNGAWPHYTGLKASKGNNGVLMLNLINEEQEDFQIYPESDDKVILIIQKYVASGGDNYPLDEIDANNIFQFNESITMKSILINALKNKETPGSLDELDGRKEWGITN